MSKPTGKRLKSLDEFEPLPWHQRRGQRVWPVVIIGLLIGGALGWFVLPRVIGSIV